MTTTGLDLGRYIKEHGSGGPHDMFLGVFASDDLPTNPWDVDNRISSVSLIVNYDTHTEPGSHWCAMRMERLYHHAGTLKGESFERGAKWFDSYGNAPDFDDAQLDQNTGFAKYMDKHAGWSTYSEIDYQGYGTDVCGEYSALWVTGFIESNSDGLMAMDQKNRDKFIRDVFEATTTS
jgi:hypothetical protein